MDVKWMLNIFKKVNHFFVQNQESMLILKNYGLNNVSVAGDTRIDSVLLTAGKSWHNPSIEKVLNGKPLIVFGSTWKGDYKLIASFINENSEKYQYIIAPHEVNQNELLELELWFKSLLAVPTIKNIREHFHSIAKIEFDKAMYRMKDLPESQRNEVEFLIQKIIRKLLHDPSRNLKEIAHAEDANIYFESFTKIFGLNQPLSKIENKLKNRPRLKVLK